MSPTQNRGRLPKGERFVLLPHWMLKSAAWRVLSPNGKAVLFEIWRRHNGSNNGQIAYAVREAEEIGITRSVASRALTELVQMGFVRVGRNSAFAAKTKEARTWALTAEPVDERLATKDFMRWHPPAESDSRSRQRDTQSRQRDRDPKNGPKTPITVPPAGPSSPKAPAVQSRERDTSSIPWGPALRTGLPRFGDEAKAQRTARAAPAQQPRPLYLQRIDDEIAEQRRAEAAAIAADAAVAAAGQATAGAPTADGDGRERAAPRDGTAVAADRLPADRAAGRTAPPHQACDEPPPVGGPTPSDGDRPAEIIPVVPPNKPSAAGIDWKQVKRISRALGL